MFCRVPITTLSTAYGNPARSIRKELECREKMPEHYYLKLQRREQVNMHLPLIRFTHGGSRTTCADTEPKQGGIR